jgi:dienelactone hydrolase
MLQRAVLLALSLLLALPVGCGAETSPRGSSSPAGQAETLAAARRGFTTKLVSRGEQEGPAETPPASSGLDLVRYAAPSGQLSAYVTRDPGDGAKHPAIVWITGGDSNSIGDVWSPSDRANDQTASAFREAGIVTMYPSLRGGNDNPGAREGFLGEVDDVLAARDHLAALPYVDPNRIYLGGHSTGGTLALLVAATSDRFQATFALGPVAALEHYGGAFTYCDASNEREMELRSPIYWLDGVARDTYVIEGARNGNWESIQLMKDESRNPRIRFFAAPGHDHFTVLAPLNELLAKKIVDGDIAITEAEIANLR